MKIPLDPKSQVQWPVGEEFSPEFQRLLGAAQEGGSMVAECLLVAGRLDPADYADSWHREWTGIADRSRERADAAFARGHVPTAQGNWLRAINYYQASMFALDDGEKRKAALEAMRACARRHIAHLAPAGEVVEIPWQERRALEGYFLPASSSGRTPVIVCMGDPGHYKEEYLFKVARHARERGLSLLAVDLLGSATDSEFGEMIGRPGLETSVSSVVDYLTTRDDVDERRIAVLGDGAGSSFVARGVALDSRFAAVVCDGGIWDMHEHSFLMNRLSPAGTEGAGSERRWPARRFHCPVLVTMGGQGWLESGLVAALFERLRARHPGISLKIFESSETAAAQGHCDNPTLANEFIFDWLADRLEAVPA